MDNRSGNQVVTFGCRLNAYESEAIKEALKKTDQKNLIVFNSCAVTSEAERELRQAVRKARRNNPEAKIVVTGCAAQIDPEKYAGMEEVDLVLGNVEKIVAESYDFSRKSKVVSRKSELSAERLTTYDSQFKTSVVMAPQLAFSRKSELSAVGLTTYDSQFKTSVVMAPQLAFSRKSELSLGRLTTYDLRLTTGVSHADHLFLAAKNSSQNFLTDHDAAKIKVNDIMSITDTAPQLVSYFENKTRAFLEIQNGCNHRCTFCIIPFGRGNSRSVAFGEIVSQVKKMVAAGHKEVVLTGVDISGYGEDLPAPLKLSQMIKRLLALVPELPRLRLSSVDVAELDEGFFEILASEPRFMPYLHLSVQSGDDMILKRMKRRHNQKQVLDFCAKARQIRPEITFGADIIAGFPTETDEMFLNSVKLIEEAGIIFTHIFPYSKREGTPAAKMPQINGKIVKERAKILRETGAAELQKFLQKQVGKTLKVLIEKDGIGKAENFLDVKILSDSENLKSDVIIEVVVLGTENNFLTGPRQNI